MNNNDMKRTWVMYLNFFTNIVESCAQDLKELVSDTCKLSYNIVIIANILFIIAYETCYTLYLIQSTWTLWVNTIMISHSTGEGTEDQRIRKLPSASRIFWLRWSIGYTWRNVSLAHMDNLFVYVSPFRTLAGSLCSLLLRKHALSKMAFAPLLYSSDPVQGRYS